jgi:hypothetical protein
VLKVLLLNELLLLLLKLLVLKLKRSLSLSYHCTAVWW